MCTLIFDIECDGFLKDLTKIHCISTEDLDTGEINVYYEDQADVYQGLLALYKADKIVGHNIITFDIPAIKKLYPKWKCNSYDDTFILSCLLNPLRSAHSIESYSEGLKVENQDWSCLTYNMLDRCVIDTKVCTKLYTMFLAQISSTNDWDEAIKLEYKVAENHVRQVAAGVDIDIEAVNKTIECIDAELSALSECMEYRLPYRISIDKHQFKKIFKKDGSLQEYVKKYFNDEAKSGLLVNG